MSSHIEQQLKPVILMLAFLGLSVHPTLGSAEEKNSKPTPSDSGKAPGKSTPFTFKVPVDVVVVNAIVTDKKGAAIKDLTVNDFKVYEDGKPQLIHTFALETYKSIQETRPDGKVAGKAPAVEEASSPRYFSLIMDDMTSNSPSQFFRSIEAMKKFVANTMEPGDLVMLYAASGRAEYPFTSDKGLLLRSLDEFYKKLNKAQNTRSECPPLSDLQAYNIVNEVNDFQSLETAMQAYCLCEPSACGQGVTPDQIKLLVRNQATLQYQILRYQTQVMIMSLRQHIRALRHFEGRKAVIFFSNGFLPMDVRYDLQDVVDKALRAGVIFNTIDSRGLYTPGPDASQAIFASASNPALVSRQLDLFPQSQSEQTSPLFQLAAETGGVFFHNNNDLYAGIKTIAERQAYYYVLTYASPNLRSDGRYHKIKLEVARPNVELSYRKGYYAPKEEISFESRKKEDILDALRAPGNLNQIPIQLSYNFYQLDDNRFQLELLSRVDIHSIKFLDEDARHRNLIHLVLVALDEKERYVDGLEKRIELNLSDESYANLLNYGFNSKVEIKVPPGRYKIKAVVRDGAQTKMGSITKMVEVP